jgi:hypothetical protein
VKGLLLAAAGSVVLAGVITVLLRTARPEWRVRALLRTFAASVPVFVAAYLLTPSDLWLLPPRLVDGRLAGVLYGLAVYAALFLGGWLQLYNLAERGCSLRILIDVDEHPGRAMTAAEVAAAYGGGRGMAWMVAKRLDGLVTEGFACVRDGRLEPTPRGRRAAAVFARARAALRLPA